MPQALSTVSIISHSITKNHSKKRKAKIRTSAMSSKISTKEKKIFRTSLIFCILFVGMVTFYLYLNLQLVEANFSLREVSKEAEKVESEIQALESAVVRGSSIDNIKKLAKDLDLKEAQNVRFVQISETGTLSLER